ncbi:hypothetical protein R1sor_000919 [Riccia sorocarpa]|uniref:Polyprotein n=1 Tax=Riccia sorocarpa TaxID=122646 RepID=A0ABD3GXM9_9MARC
MRLKHFLKVFKPDEEDWQKALQAILRMAVVKRPGGRAKSHWTAAMILLSKCPKRIPRAQNTMGLLTAWNKARMYLRIERKEFILEGECQVTAYMEILEEQGSISPEEATSIKKTTKKVKANTVDRWADWAWERNETRPLPQAEIHVVELGIEVEVQNKAWVWKVYHHGLPTMERASKWGAGDGTCARCETACPTLTGSWIEIMDKTLRKSPASYFPLVACMKTIWTERNYKSYAQQNKVIPLVVSVETAATMARARLHGMREEDRRRQSLQEALNFTRRILERTGDQLPTSPQHISQGSASGTATSEFAEARSTMEDQEDAGSQVVETGRPQAD